MIYAHDYDKEVSFVQFSGFGNDLFRRDLKTFLFHFVYRHQDTD